MQRSAHGVVAAKAALTVLVAGAMMIGHHSSTAAPAPASLTVPAPRDITGQYERYDQLRLAELETQRQVIMAERQQQAEQEANRAARRNETFIVSRSGPGSIARDPLGRKSGIKPEELEIAFRGTKMAGLGQAFCEAEEAYEVNALALAAIAIHESGWGKSEYAQVRNNLFGFAAFTENPDNATSFPSKWHSIMAAAKAIRTEYLDGRKAVTLEQIGPVWAADSWDDGDPSWAWKVADTMNLAIRRIQKEVHP